MKKEFKIVIDIPDGVSIKEMKEYISEAVGVWKGCKNPEDSIFDLNSESIRVTSIKNKLTETLPSEGDCMKHIPLPFFGTLAYDCMHDGASAMYKYISQLQTKKK